MSQEPAKDFTRHCVGRFCLDVPDTLGRTGDGYQLQHLSVEETLWKDPDDKARNGVWEARLARIRALEAQRERPGHVHGTILEKRSFDSIAAQGVLFHRFAVPEISTWGALMRRGPVDVWLQIDGDSDRQQDWAARLMEVAGAYRLPEAREKLPARGKDWFYLREGMVALPMKYMEEAKVRFESAPLDLKIEFSTKTINKAKRRGLMDAFAGAMAAFGSALTAEENIVPQKVRSRKVAGLKGEEMILRMSDKHEQRLHCLWEYPGEVKSGSHPRMVIELDGDLEQEEALLALWEKLLDSVRPAGE